ncbi:MAG: hypothetical protein A2103_05900 [Gammaproteobacteria bacterium GWF2_41_13]|nr:MAG: hypothetical protein A2103_05900 [Gammaproteobacteria bacterium GWF2_41_13]
MKKTKEKSDDKITRLMPSLDRLAQKEDSIKVTLTLTKASVEYFKQEAKKREVCYQVMIRNLIDEYVKHYSSKNDI